FWERKDNTNYRDWMIIAIADLIESGTKDDVNAFEIELMDKAEELLLHILQRVENKSLNDDRFVDFSLNSPKGRVISVLIVYCLRYARNKQFIGNSRWKSTIKSELIKRLDNDKAVELYVNLGEYLPNLYYLDQNWVNNNINNIFPKADIRMWEAAFTVYLWANNKIYKNIYDLLKENNHYSMALHYDFKETHANEQVVQHICVGFIEGWE